MIFIISLIIIIFFHELAHLIVAKLVKCPVDVFSVGFGKPVLFSKKIGTTIYQITPWILGGYNKLQDELSFNRNPNTFPNLKYRYKFLIAVAGCAINIIMGLISYFLGLKLKNFNLSYFGMISFFMGAMNFLPIPALDGGLVVYLPLCIKMFGQKRGLIFFGKVSTVFFIVLMGLNIIFLPYLIMLIYQGKI